MSMEVHVLFGGKLPSKAALTRTMRELGFPCTITDKGSLEQQRGYMPMRVRREDSGVEFDTFDDRATAEELAGSDVDARFDRSANFRWGGDEDEMLAALCTSAALAKLVNGLVVNAEEARLLTVDEAITRARMHLHVVAKPAPRQPGTRPADIKRYLKPLLERRSDLALVGRMLVIRPVRHVLRGTFLDRTSNKYCLEMRRYVRPLYMFVDGFGGINDPGGQRLNVWSPLFSPLLFDGLREDIFAQVGRIATLEDFAASVSERHDRILTHITSLVLAGQRERAAECVKSIRRGELFGGYCKDEVLAHWELLNRDIEIVCAEYHANEAETVKALKLEHLWEPSPFPVESAAGDQASRSDEPAFPLSPWIAPSPGLMQEFPEQPDDLRFARTLVRRDGTPVLVAVLTPEQADERHRQFEPYILAAGLPDGLRVIIIRHGGTDRDDPERLRSLDHLRRTTGLEQPDPWPLQPGGAAPSMRLFIEVYGRSLWFTANAWDCPGGAGRMQFSSIRVHEYGRPHLLWSCFFNLKDGEKRIDDARTGERIHTKPKLTPTDRDLLTFATPGFGEYNDLLIRFRSLLQAAGYGEMK